MQVRTRRASGMEIASDSLSRAIAEFRGVRLKRPRLPSKSARHTCPKRISISTARSKLGAIATKCVESPDLIRIRMACLPEVGHRRRRGAVPNDVRVRHRALLSSVLHHRFKLDDETIVECHSAVRTSVGAGSPCLHDRDARLG